MGLGMLHRAGFPQILPPATSGWHPRSGDTGVSSIPCWNTGGGGCPGQAGTRGLCRGGTGWQKDPENLQANTVCRSITVMVAAQGVQCEMEADGGAVSPHLHSLPLPKGAAGHWEPPHSTDTATKNSLTRDIPREGS